MVNPTQFPINYTTRNPAFSASPCPRYTGTQKPSSPLMGDHIHFGSNTLTDDPVMPFKQVHSPTHGTMDEPISPNNCMVCSVKNLLAYYGVEPKTVDHCVQTLLNAHAEKLIFESNDAPGQKEINQTALLDCLESVLNMKFTRYQKGDNHADIWKEIKATKEPKPFLVFMDGDRSRELADRHTLATGIDGSGHEPGGDHAYVVVPDKNNSQQWKVLDPWHYGKNRPPEPTLRKTEELEKYLATMYPNQSLYCFVQKPPDEKHIRAYATSKSAAHNTNGSEQVQSAPATQATPKSKPDQGSTQQSNQKPGFLNRIKNWFKRQWNKFTDACKRFWQWLKKPFSSK